MNPDDPPSAVSPGGEPATPPEPALADGLEPGAASGTGAPAGPGTFTPAVADGSLRPMAPEQVLADRIGGLIFTAVLAAGALIALILGWVLGWFPRWLDLAAGPAWLLAMSALTVFSWRWPTLEHRHLRWRVDQDGIEIHRGVLWRSVINVPRSRVQHTDVEQGPLQRRYGLSTLAVHTAGTEHAKVQLEGLARDDALAIRDFLLSLPRDDDDVV